MDSGCSCDENIIVNFITKTLNRNISDLKLIAITHFHPDHIGGAKRLQKKYKIPIATGADFNSHYNGLAGVINHLVDICLTHYVAYKSGKKLKWIFFSRKINPDFTFKDNQPLPNFNDWTVLSTPGHTYLDYSYYHHETKTCYVSDNIICHKKKLIRPYPIYSPPLYINSLNLYLNLNIETYLLAHKNKHNLSNEQITLLKDNTPSTKRTHLSLLNSLFRNILKKPFQN